MTQVRAFLRNLDRRIIAVLIAGLLALLGVQFLWVGPTVSSVTAAEKDLDQATADLEADQKRLAELQQNGTGSIEALVSKILAIEETLPRQLDDLGVAKFAATSADAAGAKLLSFSPAGEDNQPTAVEGSDVTYREYVFAIDGTIAQVIAWVDMLERGPDQVSSVVALSLNRSGSIEEGADLFNSQISATGSVRVFYVTSDPLLATPDPTASPAAPLPGAAPASPSMAVPAPTTPTTPVVPASPAPSLVPPASPAPSLVPPASPAP